MKKGFFGILVVLVIILSINLSTAQECFKGTKINTAIKASSPNLLSFHNNKLVWMGWIDDGSSLLDPYMYDFGPDGLYGTGDDSGKTDIAPFPRGQVGAHIYWNRVIWADDRNQMN